MVPMLLMVKVLEKKSIFGNIWRTFRWILLKLAVDLSLSKAHGLMKQPRPFAFGQC